MVRRLNQWMGRFVAQGTATPKQAAGMAIFEVLEGRQFMSAGGFASSPEERHGGGAITVDVLHEHENGDRQRSDRQITYSIGVIAKNLTRPTGITVGKDGSIYNTLVPTPGVPGGKN